MESLYEDFKALIVDQKIDMVTQLSKTLGKIVMENFNCKNIAIENNRIVFTIANVSSDDTFIVFKLPDLKWLHDDDLEIKISSNRREIYADLECEVRVTVTNNGKDSRGDFYIFKRDLDSRNFGYCTEAQYPYCRFSDDDTFCRWNYVCDEEDFNADALKWFMKQC